MKEVKIGRQLTALVHPRALSRKSFCREPDESAFKQIFRARARPRRATSSPSERGGGAPDSGLSSRIAGAHTILGTRECADSWQSR